jgi:transcriptional regulator with XRE-family HTH domain
MYIGRAKIIRVNYRHMEVAKVDVEKLEALRVDQGYSRRQLSLRAGLSPAAVRNIELRGSGHPDSLKRIANVLGVRASELLKANGG